jgi:hypothetical protein
MRSLWKSAKPTLAKTDGSSCNGRNKKRRRRRKRLRNDDEEDSNIRGINIRQAGRRWSEIVGNGSQGTQRTA